MHNIMRVLVNVQIIIELSKQTRSVPEPLRTPIIPKKKTDLNFNELNNQNNYDQEGRNFGKIVNHNN